MKNIRFQINYKCTFGNSLFICGNIPHLGNWNPSKALLMNWKEGHNWDIEISVPIKEIQEVNYKYFIGAQDKFQSSEIVWENGSNRIIEVSAQTFELSKMAIQNDSWEYREVRLILCSLLPVNQEPRLCGDILNILKNPSPLKMALQEIIDPQNKTRLNYCWTKKLLLQHSINEFEYKYILYDTKKEKFIQNRKVSKVFSRQKLETEVSILNRNHSSRIKLSTLLQIKLTSLRLEAAESPTDEIYLSNYLKLDSIKYSDFIFDQIRPKVFLGASINNISEVALLKKKGVQAIVNLQTNRDIQKHNPNHSEILLQYQQQEIDYIHVPVKELNSDSLMIGCAKTSKVIQELISNSKVVYIHCTYGAFRSVHSFLSYLCLFEKTNSDDAIRFINTKRPLAAPSKELLNRIVDEVTI